MTFRCVIQLLEWTSISMISWKLKATQHSLEIVPCLYNVVLCSGLSYT
jgi:hypothetical protein